MLTMFDMALLIIRMVLGLIFIAHGSQKLFGWFEGPGIAGMTGMMSSMGTANPGLLAWMAALGEFGGGVLVLIGLFTHAAAALTISVMLVAIATVHQKNGFFNTKGGYEFNLSLITLALTLILLGAGSVSLDHMLGLDVALNELPEWAVAILIAVSVGGLISYEIMRHAPSQTDVAKR